ncbi:hypothetical protein ES705_41708 [subsurface metagenome]
MPRIAPFPFNRAEKGGFLTTDKSTGTGENVYIELKVGSQDILAQKPVFSGLGNGMA